MEDQPDSLSDLELREKEARYRSFFENSSEGVWRLEFDPPIDTALPIEAQVDLAYAHGRLAECNPAMARMYGLEGTDDLVGKGLDFMVPSSDSKARAYLTSIIEAGYRATNVESVERDALGGVKEFLNSMTGMIENGHLVRVWGTQRDITQQKAAERELARTTSRLESADRIEAYFASIVASSDDAIISKDLNGIIQSANAAAERLFGYTAAELVGRPVRMLIPADRQSEEDDILHRIRHGKHVDHFETVRVKKDGTLFDVSLSISPVRSARGEIIGVSKIARDITERKRAMAELAAARRLISEEREKLLEAERVARSTAERANRLKDDFLAMVSHELRTPLHAILGWTQVMKQGRQDPTTLDRGFEVVERNARVQAQLISDLLDLSRIGQGTLRLELQDTNLDEVLTAALDTVHAEAKQKHIAIYREGGFFTDPIPADPGRLQQVIWNILANAVKFTPEGGRITVAIRRKKGAVALSVTDTGAGIRTDALAHIFDRFHQADASITRRYGGLGLGLAIVKHLVELHEGHVTAESPGEGLGSTFTITLPTSRTHRAAALSSTLAAGDVANDALEGIRVFIVEDEEDSREFLSRLLARHGAVVTAVSSAAEAIDRLSRAMPDILVSDIGLPGTDGYDLMQQIRTSHGKWARIPAIAVTAYARSEDRTRALRAGFQGHLAKPIEPVELVAAIASFRSMIDTQRGLR